MKIEFVDITDSEVDSTLTIYGNGNIVLKVEKRNHKRNGPKKEGIGWKAEEAEKQERTV